MKQFPTIQINSDDDITSRTVNMLQDRIVTAINPLLNLPLSTSNLLQGISLITGQNSINHGLNRPLVGWFVTRKDADESIYDAQDSNPLPSKTLLLVSSGDVGIDLIVF